MTPRHLILLMIHGLLLITLRTVPAAAPFPTQFEIIEIPPLTGDEQSFARGVNDKGYVVGQSVDTDPNPDTYRPLIWSPVTGQSGVVDSLGQNFDFAEANAINNSNFVAGTYRATPGTSYTGFVSREDYIVTYFTPITFEDIFFDYVTENGSACGAIETASGYEAVYYIQGSPHFIGVLPGDTHSRAFAANNSITACGISFGANPFLTNAFYYSPIGGLKQLQTLGGTYAAANGINDLGVVSGYANIFGDGAFHACYWTNPANPPEELSTLAGATNSALHDINDHFDCVGWSESSGSADHRAVVAPNGLTPLIDLNTFLQPGSGWVLREAWDISNSRNIAGWGELNGQTRGFLLRPIPAANIVAYYDFLPGGLESWSTLTSIPPFGMTTIIGTLDGLAFSPSEFFAFSIAQSPDIPITPGVPYRAVFEVSSNLANADAAPQFRLRVGQQNVNAAWVMNVDSALGAAPAQGQIFRYEFDLLPDAGISPLNPLFMAVDITHFNPADDNNGIIFLRRAWLEIAD